MNWQILYSLFPMAAALLSSGVAWYLWRYRRIEGASALIVLALCVAEWSLAYALEFTSATLTAKLWWTKAQYLGIASAPLAWLLCITRFIGKGALITPRRFAALWVVPLYTWLFALTNESHGLVWRHARLGTSGEEPILQVDYGLWFGMHLVFSYGLFLVGCVLVIRVLYTCSSYRVQATVLLLSAIVPCLGNALYILRINPFAPLDPTPFAYLLSTLLLVWYLRYFPLRATVQVEHGPVDDASPLA